MKILGIETSCDEIAAGIVEDGRKILVNEISTSVDLHQETKGIVPEIAARDAAIKMLPTINEALKKAKCNWEDIEAIAVANGPGLAGSLLVGIETARSLAYLHHKPLIPVHHVIGHIYANLLERNEEPNFPILVLTVSGGHNDLVLWKDYLDFELIGETLDDAAGEAFDKVASMLDLGFPGGPVIAKLAEEGDKKAFKFPRPMQKSGDDNFSFSGLKTAVLYKIQEIADKKTKKLSYQQKADISASFQEAVVDTLCGKLFNALEKYKTKEIHLTGGVSANKRLREKIEKFCIKQKVKFIYPNSIILCTDNASMIAIAGYYIYTKSIKKNWHYENVRLNLNYDLPKLI